MKKIRFVLPGLGNRVFTFNMPNQMSLAQNRKSSIALNIINVLAFAIFNLFLLFIPFAEQTYSVVGETAVFRYLFVMLIVNFFLLISAAILNGRKRLIDPSGFIYILIFNLVIAITGVISTTTKISNTFGATDFRSVAGLTLMCLIGIYYLINVYSSNAVRLKRTVNIIEWGYVLYVLLLLMQSISEPAAFKGNIVMVLVGFGFMWLKVLKLEKDRMFFSLAALIVSLLILLSLNLGSGDYQILASISLFSLISALPIYLLILMKRKNHIRANLKYILLRLKTLVEGRKIIGTFNHENAMRRVYFVMCLILPLVLLTVFVVSVIYSPSFFTNLVTSLKAYVDSFTSITALGVKSIVFGLGSDYYSAAKPLLANIMLMQGFVGFLSYILIWLYGIYKSRNVLLKTIKNKQSIKTVAALMFIVFFVPIYNIFNASGINLIVLWWVAFSILCAYEFSGNVNLFDSQVNSIYLIAKKYPKVGIAVKFLLILAFGAVALFGLTFILGIVK